ncbi:PQQ-dependent sugar dehydrogenase [Streptomyces sp. NPDC057238]|uniref:PQQ-dependent sugar dehydrogenase n=1 Tax=Streptomyces sp. NPDC057238 TaxID=3346060 RepID=UPI00362668D5
MWVTEKSGKKVTRVGPRTGAKSTALDLTEKAVHTEGAQDGVLGPALHPDLLKDKGRDYVYVSYTYDSNTSDAEVDQRLRIDRYTYDSRTGTLGEPKNLISGPASGSDHQSARLGYGPDGKLYYTIGDQGANQLQHYCEPNRAQRLPTKEEIESKDRIACRGKTLRLNPEDGSIPADDPVLGGVRSHVWAHGFRNSQGLDFGTDGTLYNTDQGPRTDDEVNVLTKGANYGWPHVAGHRDDKAYTFSEWSASAPTPCADLTFNDLEVPESVSRQKETDWKGRFTEPVRTFGTVDSGFDFSDPRCGERACISPTRTCPPGSAPVHRSAPWTPRVCAEVVTPAASTTRSWESPQPGPPVLPGAETPVGQPRSRVRRSGLSESPRSSMAVRRRMPVAG